MLEVGQGLGVDPGQADLLGESVVDVQARAGVHNVIRGGKVPSLLGLMKEVKELGHVYVVEIDGETGAPPSIRGEGPLAYERAEGEEAGMHVSHLVDRLEIVVKEPARKLRAALAVLNRPMPLALGLCPPDDATGLPVSPVAILLKVPLWKEIPIEIAGVNQLEAI